MSILGNSLTIPHLLGERVRASGDKPALHFKQEGTFVSRTWREVAEDVSAIASALAAAGIQPQDRVVQLAENRHDWVLCDLAIGEAAAVHVPIHAPLTGPQIVWQIVDSGAKLAFVSTPTQLAKLIPHAAELPADLVFVLQDDVPPSPTPFRVLTWREFLAGAGSATRNSASEPKLTPSSLATILYTSGTTGEPKGVMLTQGNLMSNAVATVAAFRADDEVPRADYSDQLRLNFLPLSHIFARTCDLYCWLVEGSQLAIAQSRETVLADAAVTRPTCINGVPYFYDKLQRGLVEKGLANQAGILRLVLGGRIEHCCSGGAALPDHLFDFFQSQGVPLLQGYGLSESSPVITISTARHSRRGSAGRAIPGVEVRIADDGEILTRGPHVMAGYYKNPAATADVLRNGWLLTGDYGRIDDEGYVYITGRKKEILVTAGGKNIAPVLLESLLTQDPLIAQALVIGDGRNYLSALIVPSGDALAAELAAQNIVLPSGEPVSSHPQVLALYQSRINSRLSVVSSYEQIRKITLLPRPFSLEAGELTPKLSLRRKVIEANFAEEIEAMYQK